MNGNIFCNRILVFTLLLLVLGCDHSGNPKLVKDGVLDLRTWDIQSNQSISLAGDWYFYPKQWVGKHNRSQAQDPILVAAPSAWNEFLLDPDSPKGTGYGTYAIQILWPEQDEIRALHMFSGTIASACKFYLDEDFLGEVGTIAEDKDSEILSIRTIGFSIEDYKKESYLYIQVSNHHHARGGIWTVPKLGLKDHLVAKSRSEMVQEALIIGGLCLLALYQFVFYFYRKKISSILWFVLFSVVVILRIATTGTNIFSVITYGWLTGEDVVKFDYLTISMGMALSLFYNHSLYPKAYPKYVNYIVSLPYIIPIIIVFSGSLYLLSSLRAIILIYSFLPLSLALYVLYKIYRFQLPGRVVLIIGVLSIVITASFDIISFLFNLKFPNTIEYGFLSFVFNQTLYLSQIQTKSMRSTELELLATRYQLVQAEKMSSIGQIVAGVAHEINSPIAAIQLGEANVRFIMDGLVAKLFKLIPVLDDTGKEFLKQTLEFPSDSSIIYLSSREERELKNRMLSSISHLDASAVEKEKFIDLLLQASINKIPDEWFQNIGNEKSIIILDWVSLWRGVLTKMEAIHVATERVVKIINALKTYTHLDPNSEKKMVVLSETIDTILTIFNHAFKSGMEVQKEIVDNPPIFCYPDELMQVWSNLTQNAIQAMDGKGKLYIKIQKITKNEGEYLRVEFSDTGKGVSEPKKIFHAFYTTKESGEGTGLGLFLSKQIIDKHEGLIWCEPGNPGAKFFVDLPLLSKKS
ncbi:sensor histidine kinase [Leptospira sp. 96542]|nr:sensor histidine kinase [Leptospira sp. 96542]